MCCLIRKPMEANTDSTPLSPPLCKRCGSAMHPLYSILDPTSGKQVRFFKCECGQRTVGKGHLLAPSAESLSEQT